MSHSREQLKDYIHSIHDLIRNSGSGYGMTALKIFNIFYSLKLLENKSIYFGFQNCEWSELRKLNIKTKNSNYDDFTPLHI